jgi:hypothetical protein
MIEAYQEGGMAMGFIVLLGLSAIVAGILHAAFARRWSLVVGLVNVPLPLLVGIAGWVMGRIAVERALSYSAMDPVMYAELGMQGYAEARIPLWFGAGVFLLAAVPFAVGVVRQVRRLG